MKKTGKFGIEVFFKTDADEIINAREKAIAIHRTKNIDSSGDEIELPIRKIIQKRIPSKYYVTQGHIVDENLNTSGQFDILIADNSTSPILFKSENETDYLSFESIYAIGEIKSTYYKNKNYIKEFCEKIKVVNDQLSRAKTPINQIHPSLQIQNLDKILKFESDSKRTYKNPLLKFMVFVNSGDLDLSDIGSLLNSYDSINVPNFICFLDKGILIKIRAEMDLYENDSTTHHSINIADNVIQFSTTQTKWKFGEVELYPEFYQEDNLLKWSFSYFDDNIISASSLAFLIYSINSHLRDTMLLSPNLIKYHKHLFKAKHISVLRQ